MTGAIEGSHMGHADFRAGGRIFATLGYPDKNWGMVALTPEQQNTAMREHDAWKPAAGVWGERGATLVRIAGIDEDTLGAAMTLAWQNAMTKPSAKRSTTARRSRKKR